MTTSYKSCNPYEHETKVFINQIFNVDYYLLYMLPLAISSVLNTFHIRSVYVCRINTSRENINYSNCILENIINGQNCSRMSNILGLKRVFVLRKSWKSTKMSESFIKSISKNNFEKNNVIYKVKGTSFLILQALLKLSTM